MLDGGAFSGSYILGTLYYLKELELQKKIVIDKLSGCSVGSIMCILYKLNRLDISFDMYDKLRTNFKQNGNLYIIHELLKELQTYMPEDFYKQCNDTIYLNYYDISTKTSILKNHFETNDEIIETIYKSSYVPFITGENAFYQTKFLDGFLPHIFQNENTLFINLFSNYKSIVGIFYIKNEINNIQRTIDGILEIHNFFISQKPTNMCHYINNMSITQNILFYIRSLFTYVIIFILYFFYHFNHKYSHYYSQYILFIDIFNKSLKEFIYTFIRIYMV